jgi:hypothetical protein
MKPNIRLILQEAIERGVDRGYKYAFKHTDSPSEAGILQSIEDSIWLEIDSYFSFADDYKD